MKGRYKRINGAADARDMQSRARKRGWVTGPGGSWKAVKRACNRLVRRLGKEELR